MRTRTLGTNGPELTIIGFGAWAIGGPWTYGWGPVDDEVSIQAIRRSIELGINWVDTAAVYGLGHSEEVVAKALSPFKGRIFVATKCGMVWNDKREVTNNLKPESIRRECEASLKRLNTDCIDLYQFHWPVKDTPVEESWETAIRLKEEGKIRYIGVSNFNVPLLERCEAKHHVQSLQPPFNLIDRAVAAEILPWCNAHGTGVVAYSPMLSGLLTGRFDKAKLASDDWRRKFNMFQEPMFSRILEFIETLRPIADAYGKTVGQLAVAWVLRNPAVTSAIVGARTPAQVEENINADFDLADADMETISHLLTKAAL